MDEPHPVLDYQPPPKPEGGFPPYFVAGIIVAFVGAFALIGAVHFATEPNKYAASLYQYGTPLGPQSFAKYDAAIRFAERAKVICTLVCGGCFATLFVLWSRSREIAYRFRKRLENE